MKTWDEYEKDLNDLEEDYGELNPSIILGYLYEQGLIAENGS